MNVDNGYLKEKLNTLLKQRGSATVEAVVAFVGFLFVLFTMLNVVNFCRAQMLISNAVDTTAKELSQYSYFYEMSGLDKIQNSIGGVAQVGSDNINSVIGSVDTLYQTFGQMEKDGEALADPELYGNILNAAKDGDMNFDSVTAALNNIGDDATKIDTYMNSVSNAFGDVANNPMLYLKSIAAVAGNTALDVVKSHVIAAPLARAFTTKHFGSNKDEADKTLKSLGVVDGLDGMNFNMSTIFSTQKSSGGIDEARSIHIVVYYKLHLFSFFGMASVDPVMCKEAVAGAWLGGDNVSARVTPSVKTPLPNNPNPDDETGGGNDGKDETNEQNTETNTVDLTNSKWYPKAGEEYATTKYFIEKLINDKDVVEDTGATILYGRGKEERDVAYGMAVCKDVEEAERLCYDIYKSVPELIEGKEERYLEGETDKGYEPGSIKHYVCCVYVPENISDDDIKKINSAINKEAGVWMYYIADTYPDFKPPIIQVEIVKAGGNYDFGAADE